MPANPYGWMWQLGCPCCEEEELIYLYAVNAFATGLASRFRIDTGAKVSDLSSHQASVTVVKTDSAGNVYVGGSRAASDGNVSLRKFAPDGSQAWAVDTGATVNCLAIDSAFNVVVNHADAIEKYDSDGNFDWNVNPGLSTLQRITVDANDDIIVTYGGGLRKYNAAGTFQWAFIHFGAQQGVVADASGNIYTNGRLSGTNNCHTYKLDSGGTEIARLDHGGTNIDHGGVGVDPTDGTVVLTSRHQVKKYSSDLSTLQWTYDWQASSSGERPLFLVVANDGSIYVTGEYVSAQTKAVAKLDSSGNEVWAAPGDSATLGFCDLAPGLHPVFR